MVRDDANDVIYKTEEAKFNAVVEEIIAAHEKGQPVLVGTISIEKSERLSDLLAQAGHHATRCSTPSSTSGRRRSSPRPARYGAVTIATNMAGRGTDIMLGGNPEMMARQRADRPHRAGRGALEGHPGRAGPDRGGLAPQAGRGHRRVRGGEGQGHRGGRPLRPGHRAARGAAHRQPAARPLRPPGRPRALALLPLPGGRPDARLRLQRHRLHHGTLPPAGGPAHREPHRHPLHRDRPEERGGQQLRDPQEPAQVRRRDEPAARADLRGAPEDPGGPGHPRPGARDDPRGDRGHGGPFHRPRQVTRRTGTWRNCSSSLRPLPGQPSHPTNWTWRPHPGDPQGRPHRGRQRGLRRAGGGVRRDRGGTSGRSSGW